MAIIFEKDANNNKSYTLIPEKIDPRVKDELAEFKKRNMETNGYSKGRTLQLVGRVPQQFMYNYAIFNGIPAHKHAEWYSEKKGRNMRRLLTEFDAFRMVDKL